MTRLRRLCYKR